MSFTANTQGRGFAPGYFLAEPTNSLFTQQIAQTGATTDGNNKYVKAGTPWPSNDTNAVGIVYQDVDVTSGDMPGSVVMSGKVYEDRLPVTLASAAKTALEGLGFVFLEEPTITRPY